MISDVCTAVHSAQCAVHSSQVQQTQYGNRNSHGLTLPLAYVLLHLEDSNTFLQPLLVLHKLNLCKTYNAIFFVKNKIIFMYKILIQDLNLFGT